MDLAILWYNSLQIADISQAQDEINTSGRMTVASKDFLDYKAQVEDLKC